MSYFGYFIITLFILLFFLTIILYLYWNYKKKYTRERFAFVAISGITSVTLATIPAIAVGNSWVNFVVDVLNKILGWDLEHVDMSSSDKLLIFLFYIFYISVCYVFFSNWTGRISIRQHLEEKERVKGELLRDFISIFKAKDLLKEYRAIDEEMVFDIKFPTEEALPWKKKSGLYLMLINKQVKINYEEDWHSNEACYISNYSNGGRKVAIMITLDEPSESKIMNFLRYTEKYIGAKAFKYYLLIKEGSSAKKIKILSDIEIEVRFEAELLDSLVDFSDYKRFIIESFEKQEILNGYGYKLIDIYTMPSCSLKRRSINGEIQTEEISDIENYILNWIKSDSEKNILHYWQNTDRGKVY